MDVGAEGHVACTTGAGLMSQPNNQARRDAAHTLLDAVSVWPESRDLTLPSLALERLVRDDLTIDFDSLSVASMFLIETLLASVAELGGTDKHDLVAKMRERVDIDLRDVDGAGP